MKKDISYKLFDRITRDPTIYYTCQYYFLCNTEDPDIVWVLVKSMFEYAKIKQFNLILHEVI